MARIEIPRKLSNHLAREPGGPAWLASLPETIDDLCRTWHVTLSAPFDGDASCSWVAACVRTDGSPAVLKLGFPHMESEHEIDGLAFWAGDTTVQLLKADRDLSAMLLERCDPGTSLRAVPEEEQDVVISGLLNRLWQVPKVPGPFRPLSEMIEHWCNEARKYQRRAPVPSLFEDGLSAFDELLRQPSESVLLATDLHAGNVLKARRMPWLVIDPKPFLGDRAFDATQHLLNCRGRLATDPIETINRVADLSGLDRERVRLWTFARLAVESRNSNESRHLATSLL